MWEIQVHRQVKIKSSCSLLLTFRAFSNFFFDSFTFRVCVILCWSFVTFAIHLFLFSIILDTKFQMFLSDRPRFNGNCYNRQVNTTLESILMYRNINVWLKKGMCSYLWAAKKQSKISSLKYSTFQKGSKYCICVYFVGVVNQIHKVPTYVECATK